MRWMVLLLLVGCASPQEYANRQQAEREQREANYVASLESRCRSIGYSDGTMEFRQCMLQLHSINAGNQSALQNAIIMQQFNRPFIQTQPLQLPRR